MFGYVPEDFIRAMGRIVMLSALVENLFAQVVAKLRIDTNDDVMGWPVGQLIAEFEKISRTRALPSRVVAVEDETVRLLELRNALVHNLWPFHGGAAPRGWRFVTARRRDPDGNPTKSIQISLDEMRTTITDLVAIHASLRDLFGASDLD